MKSDVSLTVLFVLPFIARILTTLSGKQLHLSALAELMSAIYKHTLHILFDGVVHVYNH